MSTKVVHCNKSDYTIYIGRPSKWGNRFSHKPTNLAEIKVASRNEAIKQYRQWLYQNPDLMEQATKELKGQILGCFCDPLPCHGHILAEVADSTILYRPVGEKEFKLIEESGWTKFPPRLPEQSIFYPVCNLEYAQEINSKWNMRDGKKGYVVKFFVHDAYLAQYEKHIVGSRVHEEYWIPAEKLEEFNNNIVGMIYRVKE